MDKYQIHKAALESDYEYALKLINLKVDLNELDTLGHTALHWAVFRGDIDLVKILLEAGAEPNVFSADGVTPKWRAQDFGLVEICELLNNYGAKVLTNEDFDKTSFAIFNSAIGQPIPKNEFANSKENIPGDSKQRKWWKLL